MQLNAGELIAFILYFAIVIAIGVVFFFRTRGGGAADYFLGGRKMGSWVGYERLASDGTSRIDPRLRNG